MKKNQKKQKRRIYIYLEVKKKYLKEKKDELERYIKYYKDWHTHYRKLEISDTIRERVSQIKKDLIEKKSMLNENVAFIDESLNKTPNQL